MAIPGTNGNPVSNNWNAREWSHNRPEETAAPEAPGNDPLVSRSADANLAEGSAGRVEGSTELPGGIDASGYVEGPNFSLDGDASFEAGLDGVEVNLSLDIEANLVEAGGDLSRTVEFEVMGETFQVDLGLGADGQVGLDGSLDLSLSFGPDGVDVSASVEGFAGARAEVTGDIAVSHEGNELFSGSASLSGTAGASGSASADLGFSGGNIEFEVSAEAAVGAGMGFELDGSFNPGNTARAAAELAGAAVREGFEEAAEFAVDLGENLVDLGEDVGGWALDRGEDLLDLGGNVLDALNPTNWF